MKPVNRCAWHLEAIESELAKTGTDDTAAARAEILVGLREKSGKTREAVSEELGISVDTLKAWESPAVAPRQITKRKEYERLAVLYGTTAAEIDAAADRGETSSLDAGQPPDVFSYIDFVASELNGPRADAMRRILDALMSPQK